MDEFAKMLHGSNNVELNGIVYCSAHERDICRDCQLDFVHLNSRCAFELPENGCPEYPNMLRNVKDLQLRKVLHKWWLEMQKALHPGLPRPLRASFIKLPRVEMPDEARNTALELKQTLLQLFRQVQGMCATQRYYFANQSKILLEDYDVFTEARELYEAELSNWFYRKFDLFALRGHVNLPKSLVKYEHIKKSKASILNTFGFFLELNTFRTFWRAMELTAEAFMFHLETFEEEADGEVVVTENEKLVLLKWVANFFWSLQHAQSRLDRLRALQYEVYQRGVFPFFPYTLTALEEDSDIHLLVVKLSKCSAHDFPLMSSLFSELRKASNIPEQMKNVNAELMAAIDELSSRFRVLEKLLLIAHLVATKDEIKSALLTFKFESEGKEINSRTDDVMEIITSLNESNDRKPMPKSPSFLQKLIERENLFRQKHEDRMIRPTLAVAVNSNGFSKQMFNVFNSNFTVLYRESIRRQWREDEYSLLGLDVAKRTQQRRSIEKKKKRPSSNYEQADMAEVRYVPPMTNVDPSLFWEVGDGKLEKYVPPVIRKKIKTRKEGTGGDPAEELVNDEGSVSADAEATDAEVHRPLDRLKHTDLTTRDILWHKVKGSLKWSNLVQLLSLLGCQILNLDGSKRKIVDTISGLCTVLHRPHPGDECRPDQRESYRVHLEDWLKIKYSHIVPQNVDETNPLDDLSNGAANET